MNDERRLVLGLQPVREVLRAHGNATTKIFLEKKESPSLEGLQRFARAKDVPFEWVPRSYLDSISKGTRHQGAAALAPPLPLTPLGEVLNDAGRLVIALDEIQDPQNFGAIVRSAHALADGAVVWPQNASAPLSPSTFRASAGAVEHAQLCRVANLRSALMSFQSAGYTIVALDGQAEQSLGEVDRTGPSVLVVGSEGKGLRKGIKRVCTQLARLPMSGRLDSVNASVAAAVSIYEAQRQRSSKSDT